MGLSVQTPRAWEEWIDVMYVRWDEIERTNATNETDGREVDWLVGSSKCQWSCGRLQEFWLIGKSLLINGLAWPGFGRVEWHLIPVSSITINHSLGKACFICMERERERDLGSFSLWERYFRLSEKFYVTFGWRWYLTFSSVRRFVIYFYLF